MSLLNMGAKLELAFSKFLRGQDGYTVIGKPIVSIEKLVVMACVMIVNYF